jgi:hypothetical protein
MSVPIRAGTPPGESAGVGSPVRFARGIQLTKAEVFDACGQLAAAGSLVEALGFSEVAGGLSTLFELLEGRLSLVDAPPGVETGGIRESR